MSLPLKLKWSSRESICAQLLFVLQSLRLEGPSPRESKYGQHHQKVRDYWGDRRRKTRRRDYKWAQRLRRGCIDLLRIFAGPEQLPALRTLIFESRENFPVRVHALETAQRLGLELSLPELTELLEESTPESMWEGCMPYTALLPLARTEETCAVVEAALSQLDPRRRAHILALDNCVELPPLLTDWLYARWIGEDRERIPQKDDNGTRRLHLKVACVTWDRPESWSFLSRFASEHFSAWKHSLWSWLPLEAFMRCVALQPETYQLAAESLLLPLPALLSHFGPEALLQRLQRAAESQRPPVYVGHYNSVRAQEFPRAAELLGEWMEARPLLLRMLSDPSLDEEAARRPLLAALFRRDEAAAIRWARESVGVPEHAALVAQLLQEMTADPKPDHRPLYLEALRSSDEIAQCFAIEGLLGLGESGAGWCDRLVSLLQSPHPGVRVRAAAGLVREGRREELPELRRLAVEAPEPWLRAEALRWLGEVDMEDSGSVVAQGLEDDGAWNDSPLGAAEAIWALSRRGTHEDLSRLLNAYPVVRTQFDSEKKYNSYVRLSLQSLLDESLRFHLAHQEGHSPEELQRPRCRESAYELLERARSPEPRAESFRLGIPRALFQPWAEAEPLVEPWG